MLLPVVVFSQDETILSGEIITEDSLSSPVHIINVTQQNGRVSELSGDFSVKVNAGDILLFSSIQFEKMEIEITSKILEENYLG